MRILLMQCSLRPFSNRCIHIPLTLAVQLTPGTVWSGTPTIYWTIARIGYTGLIDTTTSPQQHHNGVCVHAVLHAVCVCVCVNIVLQCGMRVPTQ